jgi:CubicO group peptidase (beta-lactamase class C family)
MTDLQQEIQGLLDSLVADGTETGVQAAVYIDGKLVVDAWAGTTDRGNGVAVDGDTLFPVFSTTKGIVATVTHLLVERGQVDYDTPIAQLWPEFAAHGKAGITVRHALNHTPGIPHLPAGLPPSDAADWERICEIVADLTPISAPGTEMSYHALNYGYILGEVARRADGRDFGRIVREDICRPLGIESLYVGLPEALQGQVAILEEPGAKPPIPNDAVPQSVPETLRPLHVWMNQPAARAACIPGANGMMSARAIARHYAALIPGGVDGVELLPPARIREATNPQPPTVVPADGLPFNAALGYALFCDPATPAEARSFGAGGYGGSQGYADLRTTLAFGFTRNLFAGQPTLEAIKEALGRG